MWEVRGWGEENQSEGPAEQLAKDAGSFWDGGSDLARLRGLYSFNNIYCVVNFVQAQQT